MEVNERLIVIDLYPFRYIYKFYEKLNYLQTIKKRASYQDNFFVSLDEFNNSLRSLVKNDNNAFLQKVIESSWLILNSEKSSKLSPIDEQILNEFIKARRSEDIPEILNKYSSHLKERYNLFKIIASKYKELPIVKSAQSNDTLLNYYSSRVPNREKGKATIKDANALADFIIALESACRASGNTRNLDEIIEKVKSKIKLEIDKAIQENATAIKFFGKPKILTFFEDLIYNTRDSHEFIVKLTAQDNRKYLLEKYDTLCNGLRNLLSSLDSQLSQIILQRLQGPRPTNEIMYNINNNVRNENYFSPLIKKSEDKNAKTNLVVGWFIENIINKENPTDEEIKELGQKLKVVVDELKRSDPEVVNNAVSDAKDKIQTIIKNPAIMWFLSTDLQTLLKSLGNKTKSTDEFLDQVYDDLSHGLNSNLYKLYQIKVIRERVNNSLLENLQKLDKEDPKLYSVLEKAVRSFGFDEKQAVKAVQTYTESKKNLGFYDTLVEYFTAPNDKVPLFAKIFLGVGLGVGVLSLILAASAAYDLFSSNKTSQEKMYSVSKMLFSLAGGAALLYLSYRFAKGTKDLNSTLEQIGNTQPQVNIKQPDLNTQQQTSQVSTSNVSPQPDQNQSTQNQQINQTINTQPQVNPQQPDQNKLQQTQQTPSDQNQSTQNQQINQAVNIQPQVNLQQSDQSKLQQTQQTPSNQNQVTQNIRAILKNKKDSNLPDDPIDRIFNDFLSRNNLPQLPPYVKLMNLDISDGKINPRSFQVFPRIRRVLDPSSTSGEIEYVFPINNFRISFNYRLGNHVLIYDEGSSSAFRTHDLPKIIKIIEAGSKEFYSKIKPIFSSNKNNKSSDNFRSALYAPEDFNKVRDCIFSEYILSRFPTELVYLEHPSGSLEPGYYLKIYVPPDTFNLKFLEKFNNELRNLALKAKSANTAAIIDNNINLVNKIKDEFEITASMFSYFSRGHNYPVLDKDDKREFLAFYLNDEDSMEDFVVFKGDVVHQLGLIFELLANFQVPDKELKKELSELRSRLINAVLYDRVFNKLSKN